MRINPFQEKARYEKEYYGPETLSGIRPPYSPWGEEIQKTRVVLIVDSTLKATSNMTNKTMDVNIVNLPCSSLENMTDVTCKD